MSSAAETFDFSSILGDTIVDNSGTSYPTSSLAGKYVGLYFSASWCPPCRGFTPKLAEFYTNLKASRDDFEFIFVSSDRAESDFTGYFAKMPFKALPFADRSRKASLSERFGVRGIPSFQIIGPTGEVITSEGRTEVMSDPTGASFPWRAVTLPELLSSDLSIVSPDGKPLPASTLRDSKTLLIYFSAHWCPPCRAFTPELKKWYDAQKEAGTDLELVFISSDKSEAEFLEYHKSMSWPALAYSERTAKDQFSRALGVEGLPTLVVLDTASGSVYTKQGRMKLMTKPDEFPWKPKPVESVSEQLPSVNDTKIAILFTDKLTDASAEVTVAEAFTAVATPIVESGAKILFGLGSEDDPNTGRIRDFIGLGKTKDGPTAAELVVTDFAHGGMYVMESGGELPTAASMREFVDSVLAGSATPTPIKR